MIYGLKDVDKENKRIMQIFRDAFVFRECVPVVCNLYQM